MEVSNSFKVLVTVYDEFIMMKLLPSLVKNIVSYHLIC
jgi:hypothetical protein